MAWARTLPTAARAVKRRFGSGRRLELCAGRHPHPRLALEHHGGVHRAFADEPGTLAGLDQFGHLDMHAHHVADPDRRLEVQRLRQIDGTRTWQRVPMTAEIRLAVYRPWAMRCPKRVFEA